MSLVNNGGDLGKTLAQLGSEKSTKNLVGGMVLAGAMGGFGQAVDAGATTTTLFEQTLIRSVAHDVGKAAIDAALNGQALDEDILAAALSRALITAGMASTAEAIGDASAPAQDGGAPSLNAFTHQVAHAVLGCAGGAALASEASGCAPGALGALVGELAATYHRGTHTDATLSLHENKARALAFAKVMAAASGVVAGGGGDNDEAVQIAAAAGGNAAQNNYLKHEEAQRLSALQNQRLLGQCDQHCKTEIAGLQLLDARRNQALKECVDAVSQSCNSARQEVRAAAAQYLRANLGLLDGIGGLELIYFTERAQTNQLADASLEGLFWNKAQGAAQAYVDAALAVADLLLTTQQAIFSDKQAQQALMEAAGGAWDVVKDPVRWPELLGAMSASDREALAKAYEDGDSAKVGQLLGESAANMSLSVGGVVGKAGQVVKLGKLGKALPVGPVGPVGQVGDLIDLTPGKSPVDIRHVIGADYNPKSKKVTGGHSLLTGDVRILEITSPPDVNGVYRATVEIKTPSGEWKTKMVDKTNAPQQNSMFPREWSEKKIEAEIESAWSNRKPIKGNPNGWMGQSDSGVEIVGYLNPRTTAFPVYKKGDK